MRLMRDMGLIERKGRLPSPEQLWARTFAYANSAGTVEWGGYFNAQYFADPREKIIGILRKQTQGTTRDNTADLFRQLVFQAIDD